MGEAAAAAEPIDPANADAQKNLEIAQARMKSEKMEQTRK